MKAIFSGDFQAEWKNLDLCQQAWNQILDICKEQKLELIVLLGDLKNNYNPIDGRVVIWWQNAIIKAIKLRYKVLILLGNHDRFGSYNESDNWLKILRRAGAITFDKPSVYSTDAGSLYLLPYTNVPNTRLGARKLLRQRPNRRSDILCFHCELHNAAFNKQGSIAKGKLTTKDLHCNKYKYCIGAHIHLGQQLQGTNVYYVGSPFCMDWGETNSVKRYLVLS